MRGEESTCISSTIEQTYTTTHTHICKFPAPKHSAYLMIRNGHNPAVIPISSRVASSRVTPQVTTGPSAGDSQLDRRWE